MKKPAPAQKSAYEKSPYDKKQDAQEAKRGIREGSSQDNAMDAAAMRKGYGIVKPMKPKRKL